MALIRQGTNVYVKILIKYVPCAVQRNKCIQIKSAMFPRQRCSATESMERRPASGISRNTL